LLYFGYLVGVKPWRNTRALNIPFIVLELMVLIIFTLVLILVSVTDFAIKERLADAIYAFIFIYLSLMILVVAHGVV